MRAWSRRDPCGVLLFRLFLCLRLAAASCQHPLPASAGSAKFYGCGGWEVRPAANSSARAFPEKQIKGEGGASERAQNFASTAHEKLVGLLFRHLFWKPRSPKSGRAGMSKKKSCRVRFYVVVDSHPLHSFVGQDARPHGAWYFDEAAFADRGIDPACCCRAFVMTRARVRSKDAGNECVCVCVLVCLGQAVLFFCVHARAVAGFFFFFFGHGSENTSVPFSSLPPYTSIFFRASLRASLSPWFVGRAGLVSDYRTDGLHGSLSPPSNQFYLGPPGS